MVTQSYRILIYSYIQIDNRIQIYINIQVDNSFYIEYNHYLLRNSMIQSTF